MTDILSALFALQDEKYADFQAKLTPGIPREQFIGVRVPQLRRLAKQLQGDPACEEFLRSLPHRYYDENVLHSLLLSQMKDYAACLELVDAFLPYVDNWAVCDILSPKVFRKNRALLLPEIRRWSASGHTYTCRFGMGMLMAHFLDDDFEPGYLEIPAAVRSDDYYVNMMAAWFYATALAKQWESTVHYLENRILPPWTHNKTIQKAIESYRITPEQKTYLRSLKIK